MQTRGKLLRNTDQRLRVRKVKDIDGNFQNSGTCTYVLKEKATGTTLSSGTIPYITASSGDYWVAVDKTATSSVKLYEQYEITITFTQGSNEAEFVLDLVGATQP